MSKLFALVLLCVMTSAAMAQEAKVTSLMSKELTENPGKEVLMIMVEYPPGSSDPIHRHNAQAFVYVLEGSIVMQVKGGKEVTLTPDRPSMKAQTIFMWLAATQAGPTRRNSWSS